MSCPCDTRLHPRVPDIPPGLSALPRAIGRFDDFRAAMWAGRASKTALRDWSGQAPGDLGAMLVDFWAVVADVQAFYDEVRANEAYIGTAPTDVHLSGLIASLGYRRRPATAASAWIAVEVAGIKARSMPAGTAFRSGPVGDGPPQVFETASDTTVYPAFGTFNVQPPAPDNLAEAQGLAGGVASVPGLWVDPATLSLDPGDTLVISVDDTLHITRVAATRAQTFGDEGSYTEVTFDDPLPLDPATLDVGAVKILKPAQNTRLWSATNEAGDYNALDASAMVLSNITAQIAAGDIVTLTGSDGSLSVARTSTAREEQMTVVPASTAVVTDADDEEFTVAAPKVTAPTTRLTLATSVSPGGQAKDVVVGYGLITAARLAHPPADSFKVAANDTLPFDKGWRFRRRWSDRDPRSVTALLRDPFGNGGAFPAEIDPNTATLSVGGDVADMELSAPVEALGNATLTTHGETVPSEVLGMGDARLANQSFKLKKPLTYLNVPTEAGYASTLTVWVDDIEVVEVPTLYAQPPEALVYTLREDDEGATHVTFGNGDMGARLRSGAVVTATYRSGAGADRPEADSIAQMVAPVAAVTQVHQPFEAFGGSDREDEDTLRTNAPRSALLLGRAISLADYEAVAITQNGVLAARAEWAWSPTRQRPVAQVWFAGDATIAPDLTARLRALSDPSTAIEVLTATPTPLSLSFEVTFTPGHQTDSVVIALRDALTKSRHARLAHAHPQIGAPLFRSPLIAEALQVPGVHSIDALNDHGLPVPAEGTACPVGTWFTIDPDWDGTLLLNGEETGP